MATQLEDRCPICLDSWEEPSFVMPCLHQFCYPCILRWADEKPECPLCKTGITSILHSVRADDDYVEHVVTPPETVIVRQGEGAPDDPAAQDLHRHGGPQPHTQHRALVGGLQPEQWATLFQALPSFLETLPPWLQATLQQIFSGSLREAAMVGDIAIDILTSHGMDEQHLVHMLQDSLLDYTEAFVHELIRVAVQRRRREAFHLLGLQEGLTAPAQSHAAALQHPLQTGSLAPRPTPSVGVPAANPRPPLSSLPEEEEAQEEPGVAMPRSNTSSQGRENSPVVPPRRTRRRRTSSSDDAPANKRPPLRL